MTGTQIWIMIVLAAARAIFIMGMVLCALGLANCFTALSSDPSDLTATRFAFQYAATFIQLAIAQFLLKVIHHWYASDQISNKWKETVEAFKKGYNDHIEQHKSGE